jgi:MFS family permease
MVVVSLVVLAGLACAISIPAWSAVALDATDAGGRGVWLGALATVQGLGVAGGQGLGGLIGGQWGPLAPFKIASLMLFVAVVLIIGHYRLQTHRRKIRFSLPAPQTSPTLITAPIAIASD